jgi:hypothetical protein
MKYGTCFIRLLLSTFYKESVAMNIERHLRLNLLDLQVVFLIFTCVQSRQLLDVIFLGIHMIHSNSHLMKIQKLNWL